jgi:hypothetical protein
MHRPAELRVRVCEYDGGLDRAIVSFRTVRFVQYRF